MTTPAWNHMPWPARQRLVATTRRDLRDLAHELADARRRLDAITARTAAAAALAATPARPLTVEEVTERARALLANLGPDPDAGQHMRDLLAALGGAA